MRLSSVFWVYFRMQGIVVLDYVFLRENHV